MHSSSNQLLGQNNDDRANALLQWPYQAHRKYVYNLTLRVTRLVLDMSSHIENQMFCSYYATLLYKRQIIDQIPNTSAEGVVVKVFSI